MDQYFFVPFIGESTNKIYSGRHWSVRQRLSKLGHEVTAIAVKSQNVRPVAHKVILSFNPVMAGRGRDCSNHSYAIKTIEDGMVRCGVLMADDESQVSEVRICPRIKNCSLPDGFLVKIQELLEVEQVRFILDDRIMDIFNGIAGRKGAKKAKNHGGRRFRTSRRGLLKGKV